MKSIPKILMLCVTVLAVSCTQPTDMLTVINPDGSCFREFKRSADSAFMKGDTTEDVNPFPVIIDLTYKVSWSYGDNEPSTLFPLNKYLYDSVIGSCNKVKVSNEKLPFDVVVRKEYTSVEEMAETFRLKPSHEWSSMNVTYALEKKFRWFYTYYVYQETYPTIKTDFFTLPIEDFMSNDEARFWLTGEPDMLKGMNGIEIRQSMGELEDKYNKWISKNSWYAEYEMLLKNYDSISHAPVTKERLEALKDSIYKSEVKDIQDYKMELILDTHFNTRIFSDFWNTEDSPMKQFDTQFSEQPYMLYVEKSIVYRLLMPGKVTLPYNAVLEGDTLVWKLTADRMLFDDYAVKAQSRKTNVWAFILTGLVLAIAIGSFFYKPGCIRKRRPTKKND